jgi:hypothetical protein
VVSERSRLVGVVGDDDLPPARGERLVIAEKRQCAILLPISFEIVAHLFLQSRKHGLDLRIGQAGRDVGDGNDENRHKIGSWLLALDSCLGSWLLWRCF